MNTHIRTYMYIFFKLASTGSYVHGVYCEIRVHVNESYRVHHSIVALQGCQYSG